jgi:hypothetical protein
LSSHEVCAPPRRSAPGCVLHLGGTRVWPKRTHVAPKCPASSRPKFGPNLLCARLVLGPRNHRCPIFLPKSWAGSPLLGPPPPPPFDQRPLVFLLAAAGRGGVGPPTVTHTLLSLPAGPAPVCSTHCHCAHYTWGRWATRGYSRQRQGKGSRWHPHGDPPPPPPLTSGR